MKLLNSFKKELILATRSYYFYIEIGIAVIMLIVLLFAIPTHSSMQSTEYLYLDIEEQYYQTSVNELMPSEIDKAPETVEVEADGQTYEALLIETEESKIYVMSSEEAMVAMSKAHQNIGATIRLDDNLQPQFTYYLQGYESERLQNLLKVLPSVNMDTLAERLETQEVRTISSDYVPLNNRENTVPPLVTFSGSMMGMFIMAAYIFLDKEEGVIKAYAVTASPVSRYLISKVMVLLVTSVVTGLIIVAPIMGAGVNYALLLLLLLTTGFFASTLGLLLASLYKELTKAFGVIFALMILFMLPSIAYFIPSWDPLWIRIIPSYPMLQGFKEIMLTNGDAVYALLVSAGFLAAGVILFLLTNIRFKKTLSV